MTTSSTSSNRQTRISFVVLNNDKQQEQQQEQENYEKGRSGKRYNNKSYGKSKQQSKSPPNSSSSLSTSSPPTSNRRYNNNNKNNNNNAISNQQNKKFNKHLNGKNNDNNMDSQHAAYQTKKIEKNYTEREQMLLDYAMDSFLQGHYNKLFDPYAPAPHPGLSPKQTIEAVLRSLRELDLPDKPNHGAAVLQRFCIPLTRGEKYASSLSSESSSPTSSSWRRMLRGALTPTMLAHRIGGSSDFCALLDWESIDITDGMYHHDGKYSMSQDSLSSPTVAFVNVALYFGDGIEPCLIEFELRRVGGVWLIYSARRNANDLYQT